jgi:hypothetical protein
MGNTNNNSLPLYQKYFYDLFYDNVSKSFQIPEKNNNTKPYRNQLQNRPNVNINLQKVNNVNKENNKNLKIISPINNLQNLQYNNNQNQLKSTRNLTGGKKKKKTYKKKK